MELRNKSEVILLTDQEREKNPDLHTVLLELKKLDKSDLHDFMKKVLDVVSNALDIERVSIWFFDENRTSIYCDYLYLKQYGEYANEISLNVRDYPEYFKAIKSRLILAADDAVNDPRTSELAETYLKPRGVVSIMDIPIHYHGETIGIICHEEQDSIRKWKREEMDFTAAISALVSTSLEIDFRKDKEKQFNESQRFLTTLISNLPGYVYRVNKEGENWSIQYISGGVYDLTGYKPEELIKNRVLYYSMMVNEEDKDRAKDVISKALAEKTPYKIIYRISTSEGKLKWVWEQGRGIYGPGGELTATEGFITDITEKKLYEEEIVKKNYELSALYEFGKSLSKLAEPPEIIESIGNMLGRLFKSESFYVATNNTAARTISFPYHFMQGERINSASIPYENGINEFVMNSRKPMLINSHAIETLEAFGISAGEKLPASMLLAPMTAGEKTIGVIALQDFTHPDAFTEGHLELLATVASQGAIALENAELYHAVKNSLKEKEVLLKEVHHRVKNNLQIMSSLIKLQTRFIKDEKMLEIMKETGGRMQSMSIVHTKLYNSGEYDMIDFGDYVKNLADNFSNTYGAMLREIRFEIDIRNIKLNIDTAIPCGLIINELVSNAIKYAFPDNRSGLIRISLSNNGDNNYLLMVADNGTGSSGEMDPDRSETLGLQLVSLLSKQLNGEMKFTNKQNAGVEYTLKFEESEYKARS